MPKEKTGKNLQTGGEGESPQIREYRLGANIKTGMLYILNFHKANPFLFQEFWCSKLEILVFNFLIDVRIFL